MEKLIYVLTGDGAPPLAQRLARLGDSVVPAARALGAVQMALLIPDLSDEIRSRSDTRIGGAFASVTAVFECWLPALDLRAPLEDALRPFCSSLWGYLVTESSVVPCPHACGEGERVPGITQWVINDKPDEVPLADFYREWQEVHSKLSFALHPKRESYIRNAVARELTDDAPIYRSIVLERFPSLDDYTDDARYFGDPETLKQVFEHIPTFYRFDTAIAGAMSEFRFA